MSNLENVVVTEVTNDNIGQVWNNLVSDISSASFIAVDAEMSGLGSNRGTMNSDLGERYRALCVAATTRSIISLGLACFRSNHSLSKADDSQQSDDGLQNVQGGQCIDYSVKVYNILLLCSEPYTIDPQAVKFLVDHGFDFNRQFSTGITYYKGNDTSNEHKHSMRNLFAELIRQRKPLLLHNGLADLVFIYHCFYAQCPSKLTAFMADLSEMFPNGIYDTKYVAEFCNHTTASFLLYLFKSTYLDNSSNFQCGKLYLKVTCNEEAEWSSLVPLNNSKNPQDRDSTVVVDICEKYSAYGWCVKGSNCAKSHDIDQIIEFHKAKKSSRKRKHHSSSQEQDDGTKTNEPRDAQAIKIQKLTNRPANEIGDNVTEKTTSTYLPSNSHRSGLDAFMTGYVFAAFIVSRCKCTDFSDIANSANGTQDPTSQYTCKIPYLSSDVQTCIINKLYLSGKNMPLQVCKSQYTKTSKNHNEKLLKVYLK